MDMELTHIDVTYPLWLRVSFLGTLLFPGGQARHRPESLVMR